jgi:hypothetical protein
MQANTQEAERCNLKRLPAPSGAAMDNSTQIEKMKVNREMSV